MAKKLSRAKARKILHDGTVNGKPLTSKQRRFFGAAAHGEKMHKMKDGGAVKNDSSRSLIMEGMQEGGAVQGLMDLASVLAPLSEMEREARIEALRMGLTRAREIHRRDLGEPVRAPEGSLDVSPPRERRAFDDILREEVMRAWNDIMGGQQGPAPSANPTPTPVAAGTPTP